MALDDENFDYDKLLDELQSIRKKYPKDFKVLFDSFIKANENQKGELIMSLAGVARTFLSPNVSEDDNNEPSDSDHGEASTGSSSRYKTEFEELKKLGQGGFGHVFKCRNKLDKKEYAVKKIPLNDRVDRKKILREVQALSILQHPHIVRYYQAWIEEGAFCAEGLRGAENSEDEASLVEFIAMLYIIMEFCPKTLLEDGQREQSIVWLHFRHMVEGLVHIHECGIIHRDISPSNIFLDPMSRIKIGDFGLAKFFVINGGSPTICGTGSIGNRIYRAPEMSQKNPQIDCKVDIFSLGLVLVELLHPMDTTHEKMVVFKDARDGIFPSSWSSEEKALVSELLALSPQVRPSAKELLQKLLLNFSAGYMQTLEEQFNSLRKEVDSLKRVMERKKDEF